MRISLGAKPLCYPQNVFMVATYAEDGTPDVMNAAWGGISDFQQICLCLSASHKTVANLIARQAFTVSMATAETVIPCDYVGIESANDVPNKFEKAGFHATKSELVDAPLIDELPFALECKVQSYDPKTGLLFGEIVNVSADESIMDGNNIDLSKFHPIVFDAVNSGYLTLGERIADAFGCGAALK
ncbi:MAG: flavin reductase [Coriobacteriales bacterium]|nr:flavin reductase [Coriobacteriales bacterium]